MAISEHDRRGGEQHSAEPVSRGVIPRAAPAHWFRRSPIPAMLTAIADAAAFAIAVAFVDFIARDAAIFVSVGLLTQMVIRSYRHRMALSVLDDLPRSGLALIVPAVALAAATPFGALPDRVPAAMAVALAGMAVGRIVVNLVLRFLRHRGVLVERALVVGAGAVGIELHHTFTTHPEYGIECVGLVDDVPAESNLPLVGRIGDLGDLIDTYGVRQIIVAFGPRGEQELVSVLRAVRQRPVDLAIVPRFFELGLAPSGPDVESVWGIPLYRVRRSALSRLTWPVKRLTDVVAASTFLLLTAPVMLILALAVKLSSPGPILFRQLRIGQFGREVELFKFRSMRVNDDSDVKWNVANDDRLTWVGKWMRRTSLDELPQFWNILRGDMSLVGPRPERPHFVDQFSEEVAGYADRHRLPVGLTGLAQIHGLRGDTSIAERARFDNAYVEHWSPWLDFKIAMRTFTAIVRDARSGGDDDTEVISDPGAPEAAPDPSNVVRLARPDRDDTR